MKRSAGYSAPEPMDSAAASRANLARSLAGAMKTSLLGVDENTLQLQERIDQHQRSVDFENTKRKILEEVERDRDRGLM